MSSFEGKSMQAPYNVLGYRVDFYVHDYKLATEIDKNGHNYRNIDFVIKRPKIIEQELSCKFIRMDLDKEEFDIFIAINETFRHIKQSTKKPIINKISARLLGLEFKSDEIIKSEAMKFIVKPIVSVARKIQQMRIQVL